MGSSSSKQISSSSSKNNDDEILNPTDATSESNKKDSDTVLPNESVDECAEHVDVEHGEGGPTNNDDQVKPPPEDGGDEPNKQPENVELSDNETQLVEIVHAEYHHNLAPTQPKMTNQTDQHPEIVVEEIEIKIENENGELENMKIFQKLKGDALTFYLDEKSFEYTTPHGYNKDNPNNCNLVFCLLTDNGNFIVDSSPNGQFKLNQRDVMIPLKWKRNNQLICYLALTLKLSNGKTNVTLTKWTPTEQFILNFVKLPYTTTASSKKDTEFFVI